MVQSLVGAREVVANHVQHLPKLHFSVDSHGSVVHDSEQPEHFDGFVSVRSKDGDESNTHPDLILREAGSKPLERTTAVITSHSGAFFLLQ